VIEVENLTRRFGPHVAVDDLSFRLEAGEVVGFLGPNGAGKSTTMRMLAGFLPATRGRITIGGFDVLRQSLEVRRRIGYLPENVPLYAEHRVEEMLRFQARLHRIPRGERTARIGRALERVGLTDRRRSLVGSLSRGLRQRAGLAVSLLPEPDVLILDEPTSGLDPIQRIEVRKLVLDLASEHTVLLSSHILAEVEAICPRVLIIDRGRCLADGSREELVEELGGGGALVRVEAAVLDAAEAARLLSSLPGVETVEVGERVGIHTEFRVRGEGDLREDVGALAMAKQWALRELSWERPSLERLFASLVLGEASATSVPRTVAPTAAPTAAPEPTSPISTGLELSVSGGAPTSAPSAAPMLNPFERRPDASSSAGGAATDGAPSAGSRAERPPGGPTLNPFERPRTQSDAPASDDGTDDRTGDRADEEKGA